MPAVQRPRDRHPADRAGLVCLHGHDALPCVRGDRRMSMPEGTAVALAEPAAAPAVAEAPGTLLAAIVGMAKDPAVNIPALQALMAMQERLEERAAKRAFIAAFAGPSGHLPRAKQGGTVPLA